MKVVISWLKQLVSERDYLSEENEEFLKQHSQSIALRHLENFLLRLRVGRKINLPSREMFNYLQRIRSKMKEKNGRLLSDKNSGKKA